jgi:hypothetical protein
MGVCHVHACEVRIARGRVLCDRHKAMVTPAAWQRLMDRAACNKDAPALREARRGNKLVVEVDDG